MAKLDAVKEKLSQVQASVSEKLDKIALFKKWREGRKQRAQAAAADVSLGAIYRQGGVATRLQVITFYVLLLACLATTVLAGRKFFLRLAQSSKENEKLKEEYSHGLEELSQRVVEKANLVSVGKFTANAYSPGKAGGLMAVDVWLRMSEPSAADFAQKNDTVIYDGVVSGFNRAYRDELNPLEAEGAAAIKAMVLEEVNKSLPKGKAEEVFFQNLVVQ
jgi:hypothetical protein